MKMRITWMIENKKLALVVVKFWRPFRQFNSVVLAVRFENPKLRELFRIILELNL
jgi:hypothetical protein